MQVDREPIFLHWHFRELDEGVSRVQRGVWARESSPKLPEGKREVLGRQFGRNRDSACMAMLATLVQVIVFC